MKNRGFTLIELMVVIFIISILSVAFVTNYRGGEKEFALKRSVYKLGQGIRYAQEKTIASQEFKGDFQGGYGVYLVENTSQYVLFIDCNGDGEYNGSDLTCADCTSGSCIAGRYTEEIETSSLETGVSISNISSDTGGEFSVVFYPPDPMVTFSPDAQEVTIDLTAEVSGEQDVKSVKLNKAGLISIMQ